MQPREHPQRRALNDEVHARPPLRLAGAQRIVFLAIQHEPGDRAAQRDALARFAAQAGAQLPEGNPDHVVVTFGPIRLKWEGHTEFTSYTFCGDRREGESPAQLLARAGWPSIAADLPGEVVVAVSVELTPFAGEEPPPDAYRPEGETVIGGALAEGRAWGYADFRIRADGFTHFLILNRSMGLGQAGRMVQRVLDIETYRTMALAAFPVARSSQPELRAMESELGGIVERLATTGPEDEPGLLDGLTRLAARVERLHNATRYRFDAAEAYDAIVRRRLEELREVRIPGLSTIEEFMQRRMAPAMATCRSTSRRIDDLAGRVSRASELLRTRVDIVREQQNQEMLASLNRRQRLQLRLQQAVEGLSIVVLTYYGASLAGVVAKAAKSAGLDVNPDVVAGIAVPVVALLVFAAARRVRKSLRGEGGP